MYLKVSRWIFRFKPTSVSITKQLLSLNVLSSSLMKVPAFTMLKDVQRQLTQLPAFMRLFVEIFALDGAYMRYSTIQNWSDSVYNLVTKRATAKKNATVEWIDGNLGAEVTMKYHLFTLMEKVRVVPCLQSPSPMQVNTKIQELR